MNTKLKPLSSLSLALLAALGTQAVKADEGKVYADFNLRYEGVSQDNALEDADALTLRTRLGYKTATYSGFSGQLEVENTLEVIDDFAVPPTGDRVGEFSVVADPDHTEIDQAFVQYKNDKLSAKLGRQVITLDGHRFVGHVGWRQDRQTFDALVVNYQIADGFNINASYIDKRNRIFAEEADIQSKDMLLNSSYKTPIGKLTAYAYLLEVDNNTNNSLDTIGMSLRGSKELAGTKVSYGAEYASQEIGDAIDTDYLQLEVGATFAGITAKLAYENLGTDDGQAGFATPLATLHKFNGWADQFLATPKEGLQDINFSLGGKLAGGKWKAIYHDFSSDTALQGTDDLGSEINLVYTRKFTDNLGGGIKFADYSAGSSVFNKVDTQKTWVWLGVKF